MSVATQIQARLAALEPESLELTDESGQHVGHAGAQRGGGHYALVIVARRFAGLNLQQRHRLVYQTLGDLMQREIHALAIRAYTPDEL